MFGNPRKSSDEEFDDLDLLALENESLTRAPLISPMQSPILPDEVMAFRLGGGSLGPSLVRSMAAGHHISYYNKETEEDIDVLLGELL